MRPYDAQRWDGIRIAMAYIGTVIGAGFASGQEILQFFTRYGYPSFWAVLCSTLLFVIVGHRILAVGNRLGVRSFRGLTAAIFGPLSPAVDIYLGMAFLLLCGAMFAGAGALFYEQWGLPYQVGAILTAGAAMGVTIYGVRGILTVNSLLVPLIIVFNLVILVFVWRLNYNPVVSAGVKAGDIFPLIRTGITYASFNLILSIGVLAPMGGVLRDRKSLYTGSILGGCLLGGMLAAGNYSLLHFIPEVFHQEIPILHIVRRMGGAAVSLYALVIWFGVLTTAIANMFSVTSLMEEVFRLKKNAAVIIGTTLVGLLLCTLGFSNIVSWFYPVLGMIGFVLIVIMIICG